MVQVLINGFGFAWSRSLRVNEYRAWGLGIYKALFTT